MDYSLYDEIAKSVKYVRSKTGNRAPKLALILGSGLNKVTDALANPVVIPYSKIDGFPTTGVIGHSGEMLLGEFEGHYILCLSGRVHAYEGLPVAMLGYGVRVLAALGVEKLIITNAAGSLTTGMPAGSLMVIDDHINLTSINPLTGSNDARLGVRFLDMTTSWDEEFRELADSAASQSGIRLYHGIYMYWAGPLFETPAEIRSMRVLGADAVGMSTVPECIAARHSGMRVLGISCITNLAAGMEGVALSHDHTLSEGAKAAVQLELLLKALIPKMVSSYAGSRATTP